KRKRMKPVNNHFHSVIGIFRAGTILMVIQKPANSSQTIEP
ncbi:hypothetical protein D047_0490B, partial [Vibrio parahaemolyticus VPTS-2010_2]